MSQHQDAERALAPFFDNGILNRVVSRQSSGKEATVYCCEAGPSLETGRLVAAKIYRSPERRAFKGHFEYAAGRHVKGRTARQAIKTRNPIGRQMLFENWVAFEYQVLGRLYRAGVPSPEPLAFADLSMLMEYIGDEEASAPHLRNVILPKRECERVLSEIFQTIEDMLSINLIHGDLSPYNILFWEERPFFIDVPQALDPRVHPQAREVLQRDILRITEWAEHNGVRADGYAFAADLWQRWWEGDL